MESNALEDPQPEVFSPLSQSVPAQFLKGSHALNSYLKHSCTFDLKIQASGAKVRANAADELFILFPNLQQIISLDFNYQRRALFRRVPVQDFCIIENYPLELFQSVHAQTSALTAELVRRQALVGWSDDRLLLAQKSSFRLLPHSYGPIEAVIGRVGEDEVELLLHLAPKAENDFEHTFVALKCALPRKGWGSAGRGRKWLQETGRTSVGGQERGVRELTTHYMLIGAHAVTFIGLWLDENNFDIETTWSLLPRGQVALNRCRMQLIFKHASDVMLVDLQEKTAQRLLDDPQRRVHVFASDPGRNQLYYAHGPGLYRGSWTESLKPLVELGSYGGYGFFDNLNGEEMPFSLQVTGRCLVVETAREIFVKELLTLAVESVDEDYTFFPAQGLCPNPWRDRALSYMLTPPQLDNVRRYQLQHPRRGCFCLMDCLGVLTEELGLELLSYDDLGLLHSFGTRIRDELAAIVLSALDPESVSLVEGSLRHQKYVFWAAGAYYFLSVHADAPSLYQLIDAGGAGPEALVFANKDFSCVLFGDELNTLVGGELLVHAVHGKNARFFPTLDREMLVGAPAAPGKGELTLYCFKALEKLCTLPLARSRLHPFAPLRHFFYQIDSDFCFFATDAQEFAFDNRKRLNLREYLYLQSLIFGRKREAIDHHRDHAALVEDSLVLRLYFSPLWAAMFNAAKEAPQLLEEFHYPWRLRANHPLILSRSINSQRHMLLCARAMMRSWGRREFQPMKREEFHALLESDTPESDSVLVHVLQKLEDFDGGYRYTLDIRRPLPQPIVSHETAVNQFLPATFARLVRVPQMHCPPFSLAINVAKQRLIGSMEGSRVEDVVFVSGHFRSEKEFKVAFVEEIAREELFAQTQSPSQRRTELLSRFFRLNANVGLGMGTLSSHLLLQKYKKTENSVFALSPYRFIVLQKWRRLRYFSWLQALLFTALLLIYTSYLFLPDQSALYVPVVVLAGLFMLQELSVGVMDFRDYFTDYENYFDLSGYTLVIISTALTARLPAPAQPDYALLSLQVVSMNLLYYRFFIYLKILPFLTHLVVAVMEVTWQAKDLLVVLGVVVVALGIVYAKAMYGSQVEVYVPQVYFALWGSVGALNPATPMQYFILALIGVFLSLLLVNFLIAKMTVVYNNLAPRKRMLEFQYRAKLVHESELGMRFRLLLLGLVWPKYRMVGTGLARFVPEPEEVYTFIATNDRENFLQDLAQDRASIYDLGPGRKAVKKVREETATLQSEFDRKFGVLERKFAKLLTRRRKGSRMVLNAGFSQAQRVKGHSIDGFQKELAF